MEVNDPSGKPTRVMTDDQYREWVRQAVSGEIWRKFAAALSIFGLTTVFGVWTYTSNVTNTAIADKIQSQTRNSRRQDGKAGLATRSRIRSGTTS